MAIHQIADIYDSSKRCKKTYKDMEQYIDFKGENNGETSK